MSDNMAIRETLYEEEGDRMETTPTPKALQHKFSRRVGEVLLGEGLIDEMQLRLALERQRESGGFLVENLVALGYAKPESVGKYLDQATGFPFVDLSQVTIDLELARVLPEALARRKLALPFAEKDGEVLVALADPLNIATVDELASRLGKRIQPHLAFSFDLEEAISRAFTAKHKAEAVIAEMGGSSLAQDFTDDELIGLASDAPIVRLIHGIIDSAVNLGASDIHIEPHEETVRVRYRLDGLLFDQMNIPRGSLAAAVSRVKVMANLNIAERRRPQDGRLMFRDEGGREFDLRISIMPTVYGEKVVMRILEKNTSTASIEKLGFFPEQRQLFERFIKKQHGIVLVTGPTGSGKSTTLFAALSKINNPALNINTIEDPVEYHLPGANQVAVNPKIGVTFATGLRTLVRQDPDVIMVGEIRDAETAEIAVQAALTGHLVMSTLHTNDAPGALVRLQNMGVEPYLISSAIIGLVGQRLLRTVCPNCKRQEVASAGTLEALGLKPDGRGPIMVSRGHGCPKCSGRGMKGRTATYEIMAMSDSIRDKVLARCSAADLMAQAVKDGMVPMRDAGVRKVLEGVTTPEEVLRVLYVED